jgi:hypothetical protein
MESLDGRVAMVTGARTHRIPEVAFRPVSETSWG